MTFEQALPYIKEGRVYTRAGWGVITVNKVIFRQNNNSVLADIVPKMSSLPQEAKNLIAKEQLASITYGNQVIMMDTNTGNCKNYIPDWEDIFADDWYWVDKAADDVYYQ